MKSDAIKHVAVRKVGGARGYAAKFAAILTAMLAGCSDGTAPSTQSVRAVASLSAAQEMGRETRRAGNRRIKSGNHELTLNLDSLRLSDNAGRSVVIPEEVAQRMATDFERLAALDSFFEKLMADPRYKACLEQGKHSKKKVRLRMAPSSTSLSSLRLAAIGSAESYQHINSRKNTELDPASCGDWANQMSELYAQYNAINVNFFEIAAVALATGITIGANWYEIAPGVIATTAITQLVNLYYALQTLSWQIDITRATMAGLGCIQQLPTVVVTGSVGSNGVSGSITTCQIWIVEVQVSYDGGATWWTTSSELRLVCP